MQRIVVRVDDEAVGWSVSVRMDRADGPELASYSMTQTLIGQRRVPAAPASRAPDYDLPHGPMCAGDAHAVAALLDRVARCRTVADDVAVYGRWLFECLLAPAWPLVRGHADAVRGQAVELALRWPAEATDLHRLVWEAMRDAEGPLAGHPSGVVAVTRLVPGRARSVRTVTGIPSVLFATSVALTDPTIRPGAMYMGLLRELDLAGRCRAHAVAPVSAEGLHAAYERWRPDVVHVVAHGVPRPGGDAAVLLTGPDGGPQEVDADGLLAALTAGGVQPLAVALSVCHTGSPGAAGGSADSSADAAPLAARLVAGGVPVVSAMAGEVSESACRLYTRRLAAAVHDGQPVVLASAHGRRAALLGSEQPSADIDWALPALYLAEHVDPGHRLVDATTSAALTRLSAQLDLRREPVFIGRQDVLQAADDAVEPDGAVNVIAVTAKGSTSGLGGTRLLQEIGWRVLRDGHVPLLMGPYQDPRATPTTSWSLVHTVVSRLVVVAQQLDLSPFVPLTLAFELGDEADALSTAVEGAGVHRSLARATLHRAVNRLRTWPGVVDPSILRALLSQDLAELARRAAAGWGPPFGAHSRVVLLCDDVHEWAAVGGGGPHDGVAADTALGCLLQVLGGGGLEATPVVLTASTTLGAGGSVALWTANGRPGMRVFPMDDLTPEERVLGYQWVLLHPWTTKPEEERELFGRVYTPRPGRTANWEATLRAVGGRPTDVTERLYHYVYAAYLNEGCRQDDDEGAWSSYVRDHPGYRL